VTYTVIPDIKMMRDVLYSLCFTIVSCETYVIKRVYIIS